MEEEFTKFHTPDSAIYLNKMNEVKAMPLLRHISSSITASSREQGPSGERETNVTVGTHYGGTVYKCIWKWMENSESGHVTTLIINKWRLVRMHKFFL